jgi:hypothetical protein
VIRSVPYLQPRAGNARALAECCPVRAAHGDGLAELLEQDLGLELQGKLYEIVVEAVN